MIVDDEDADHRMPATACGGARASGTRHGHAGAAARRAPDDGAPAEQSRAIAIPPRPKPRLRAPRERNPGAVVGDHQAQPAARHLEADRRFARAACLRTFASASVAMCWSSDSTAAGSGPDRRCRHARARRCPR